MNQVRKNEDYAKQLMETRGYPVDNVERLNPLGVRDVFGINSKGSSLVLRLASSVKVDPQYNSSLSLERDAANYELVCRKAGLPVPKVLEQGSYEGVGFLVATRLPGVHWRHFLEQKGYSKSAYLQSLRFLGEDIARAHQITFPSYGNVFGEHVKPEGITNFADRLEEIIERKLEAERQKKALSSKEFKEVEAAFQDAFGGIRQRLSERESSPTLILTNLHPMNFLVDETGKPSGYPDLQHSQAGVIALEMYNLGLQLFNYFDRDTFDQARLAFLQGYTSAGGSYNPEDPLDSELEALLSAGHTLSAVTAYHDVKDGLRDTWSGQFKHILMQVINTKKMDYSSFANVIRQKTKQPMHPS